MQGTANTSGLLDAELEALAVAMNKVDEGDQAAYLSGWLAFQQRWAEQLPMIPLYSNTYYDVFTPALRNYHPDQHPDLGSTLLYAELNR